MPKYNCEEVPERQFQTEKVNFTKNPGAHFTLKISANQRFRTYAIWSTSLKWLQRKICKHSKAAVIDFLYLKESSQCKLTILCTEGHVN